MCLNAKCDLFWRRVGDLAPEAQEYTLAFLELSGRGRREAYDFEVCRISPLCPQCAPTELLGQRDVTRVRCWTISPFVLVGRASCRQSISHRTTEATTFEPAIQKSPPDHKSWPMQHMTHRQVLRLRWMRLSKNYKRALTLSIQPQRVGS